LIWELLCSFLYLRGVSGPAGLLLEQQCDLKNKHGAQVAWSNRASPLRLVKNAIFIR
jgi:hypothetical protein